MNTNIQSKVAKRLSSAIAIGAMLALGLSSVLLFGSIGPAAAGKSGQQRNSSVSRIPQPDVRDHRTKPTVTDHRERTHDHRTSTTPRPTSGGVTVSDTKRGRHAITKRNKIPCYGNLC
jgi:hypothetical protein